MLWLITKKMYTELFNSVTKAIDTLVEAQKTAEEIYIDSCDENEEKEKSIKIVK